MFGLDRLAAQAVIAGVILVAAGSAVLWYGSTRYDAGVAAEREHWAEVIRMTNRTIDGLNASVDEAKRLRDLALDLPIQTINQTKFVPVAAEVVKACSYPESVRKALNSINVRKP